MLHIDGEDVQGEYGKNKKEKGRRKKDFGKVFKAVKVISDSAVLEDI